jgi:putative flavoprotein involved in K+ transport
VQDIDTVVIGGGQAGLATGYHLKRLGQDHLILDEHERPGDVWRERWDSLRLFTPGRYSSLPGMAIPGFAHSLPGKDDVAAYFQAYAAQFDLPVRGCTHVERLTFEDGRYLVHARYRQFRAANVVVATGTFHHPRIPEFADSLRGGIVQLHSSAYQRPSQIQDGPVLVVGAGSSGSEIAMELAAGHKVWLSGRDPGQEPIAPRLLDDRVVTPLMWFMASRVINVANPIGRKVRNSFLNPPRGIPRGRVTRKQILNAGIDWVPRTTSVTGGLPQLEDGRTLDVANVVWCTGFVPDFSWIELPVFADGGWPRHERGIVPSRPGLYFMGLPFQRTLSSALIGGVGRDAQHIARHLAQRAARDAA